VAVLSEEQIQQRLSGSEWVLAETGARAIAREYKLADFAGAIELVNRVAALAEEANHHPDILVHGWNKVRLTLCTHSQGGLTEADFALARQIDRLFHGRA
jgi:4a-hydroxytetrahydrobiopterin dehydratase